MGASGEKFGQSRRRLRDGVGPHHSGGIEAVPPRGRDQLGLERAKI
jgi:hypothetical protein